ncbi:SAF domain-containing protein [Lentzea sp. NPDC058450]|uniref:SAF domain-containing protein n=1 Tax=Lentzea sp. NPDC058450 TaxID=3346505 RepID=UPI0036496D7F
MTFSTTLPDRVRSLLRRPLSVAWRRFLALGLTLSALVTFFWPDVGHPTLVASRDLPAGASLTAADLRLVSLPSPVPGTFRNSTDLVGRPLASPTRAGIPLTDVDLATTAPDQASTAVQLADQALAAVVRPGARVDVISSSGEVLAENATVRETQGQVVVLTLPRLNATRVAAMSLDQALAVTLR